MFYLKVLHDVEFNECICNYIYILYIFFILYIIIIMYNYYIYTYMCSLIAHAESNHFIKIDTFASNRLVIDTVKISKNIDYSDTFR